MIYLIVWLPIIGFLSGSVYRKYRDNKRFEHLEEELQVMEESRNKYLDISLKLSNDNSQLRKKLEYFGNHPAFQNKNDSETIKKLKTRIILAEKKLMDNGLL